MERFEQQTVVITGAASGIGRACAQRFAAEGAFVVLIDREADALETTQSQLADTRRCRLHALDIADESGVEQCVETLTAEHGRIDDASYITGQALAVDGGNTSSLNMPGMKV